MGKASDTITALTLSGTATPIAATPRRAVVVAPVERP